MKYVLDANIFISASRLYYSFDFGSKFWDFLLDNAQKGTIISIDKVYEEIKQGDDKLKKWADEKFKDYFMNTQNEDVLNAYAEIVRWAYKQKDKYYASAINEFMRENNADTWLIAFAKTYKYTIVTNEKFNPDIKKKIPIPNVCNHYKIQYVDTFDMLRNLNFRI